MHRSSEAIGTIAAALAKAQVELVNPEKSLIATIGPGSSTQSERTFRYAPLSSGLEIVRKVLGRHEIAVIQTTVIDQSGLIRLSTVLAHASGEWLSSDWPVCPSSETANPQRLGAALTYARRYALFTVVGIAGEDDVDAPPQLAPSDETLPAPEVAVRSPSAQKKRPGALPPIEQLNSEASRQRRQELSAELSSINQVTDAVAWARRVVAEKRYLEATDAAEIERAFSAKIADLEAQEGRKKPQTNGIRANVRKKGDARKSAPPPPSTAVISPVPTQAPRRRNRAHLRFVAAQPCLLCGRSPSDPHHIRFAQPRALGLKVSDEYTVPLCRTHHGELHTRGDERAWWESVHLDPLPIANHLWQVSRTGSQQEASSKLAKAMQPDGRETAGPTP